MLLIGLAQGHAKAFRMENAHNPCDSATNAKGPRFFTPAEDGLRQDWSKEVVFMNPPYGRVIGLWVRKAYESAQAGAVVVCLLPARTDTRWWHDCIRPGNNVYRGERTAVNCRDDIHTRTPPTFHGRGTHRTIEGISRERTNAKGVCCTEWIESVLAEYLASKIEEVGQRR